MADFIIERMPSQAEPTTAEVAEFVIEKMPAPGDAFDAARDIAYQAPQGFNEGLDDVINAPYSLIRKAVNALGGNMPEAQRHIAKTFNSGVEPVGAAGRMARTAGEVVGSSVPFAVAPMALALRPAAAVAPSAVGRGGAPLATPAIAPQTTAQGVGHDILQGIRTNPTGAAQIEAASAAGSGAATALAREAEAGPLAETMAGLAGGFVPALAPAARSLLRPDAIPAGKPSAPPPAAGAAQTEPAPARQAPAERKQPPVASYEAPAPGKVVTPDGSMEIDVSPQLVELDDLRLSEGGLQPRDRSRDEYVQEARERATKLDPSRLQGDRVSDSGAPIIMADGSTILSGNGRALSIAEVYANPNLAGQRDAYRASLGPDAANMRKPVLVMRSTLAGPDAERFAAASNTPRAARMSATERAAADAKALGDDFKLYQGGEFDSPQNIDFMRSFVSKAVPPAERASISKDGRLTKEGSDRMRGAVLASAFDDTDTLSRLLESTDDNVRGLSGAMTDAAPVFASLRADIGGGHVLPGLDPTKDIQEAVKLVASLRARGTTPQAHFAQLDAFGGVPKGVEDWVRAFYSDDMGNQLSRPQISAMMRAYADEAAKHAPGGLFADNTTAGDVLKVARRAVGSVVDEAPAPGPAAAAAGAPPAAAAPSGTPVYDGQGRVAGHIDNAGNFTGGAAPGDRMPDGRPLPPDDAVPAGPAAAAGGGEPPAPPSGGGIGLPPQTGPNRAQRARPPSYLSREFRPEQATRDDLLEAGERTGIPISRAVASESDLERRVAAGVSDAVLVGQPLREAAGKTLDALQAATEKVLRAFGSGERWNAGNAASLAIREWMTTGSRDVTKRLYTEVAKQFNKKLTSAVPRTKAISDDLAREIAESTSEVNQRALDLIQGALKKPGGMTYDGLIKLRQDIGARFDGSMMPEPGTPIPALKRIYGALSEDIHELVFRSGGEKALNRYMKAERVNQLAAQKRKELADLVGDSATAPASRESVVDGILAKAGSKKSADLTGLLEARKIAGSEAWDEIAAHAISRMGFTDDGGFSAERFFTEYSKMTENGRRVLFGSTGKGDLKQTLDDIATIASKARSLNRMRNTSGTFTSASAVNLVATGVTGVLFHPLTVALPMVGTYAIAKMLARPATAKQVSRWAQARVKLLEAPSQSAQLQYALVSRNLAHALAEEFDEDEDKIGQTLLSAGAP